MPQPCRYVDRSANVENREALLLRPKLAMHIAVIANMWTYAEIRIGRVLGVILGADAEIGVTMYMSLIGEAPRNALMLAAAESKLPPDLLAEFRLLMSSLNGPKKMRNDVVHGVWEVVNHLADSIILIDSKAWAKHVSTYGPMHESAARHTMQQIESSAAFEKSMATYLDSRLEYKEKDFLEIQAAINKAIDELTSFYWKIYPISFPPLPSSANLTG